MHCRRLLRLAAGAVVALTACAAVASEPATMRLDFFHTGGRDTEIFAVERLVIEPLPWPGNLSRNVDDTNFGVYRFELRGPDG